MVNRDDIEPLEDEDSDVEDDVDAIDGKTEEEPMAEEEAEDEGFLKSMMESLVEKCSLLKTRAGRAGLVHNFLRGLQMMTAPVPSGESRLKMKFRKQNHKFENSTSFPETR